MPPRPSIEVDPRQAAKLIAAIQRDSKNFSGSMRQSITWGGIKVAESLGAQTPVSKKKRKIVENPDERWKEDNRRSRYGVMVLRQDKKPYFRPISGSGEHGKIRFRSKKTGEMLVRDKNTGEVRRQTFALGGKPDQVPGLTQSIRRNIGRSGFAKRSWRFLKMRARRGGAVYINGVPNMGEVVWSGGKENPTITINNRVSYMNKILKGGASAVSNAMWAAADGMMYQMDKGLRKKMGAK